jgi:hypothetical protein
MAWKSEEDQWADSMVVLKVVKTVVWTAGLSDSSKVQMMVDPSVQ